MGGDGRLRHMNDLLVLVAFIVTFWCGWESGRLHQLREDVKKGRVGVDDG